VDGKAGGSGCVTGGDLADAGREVDEAGHSGEETGDESDGQEIRHVEHEPEHGGELGEGGDLAGPMGLDVALADELIDQEGAADAGEVAEDDEGGKPEGEVLPPAGEAEGDDGGKQHEFVCQGVEDGTEAALLIEMAGDVAVDRVADGGEGEDADGGPAQGFVGVVLRDALPVVDRNADEDGDQQDAEEGDLSGEGHEGGGQVFYSGLGGFANQRGMGGGSGGILEAVGLAMRGGSPCRQEMLWEAGWGSGIWGRWGLAREQDAAR
jgi:hypothetical protein